MDSSPPKTSNQIVADALAQFLAAAAEQAGPKLEDVLTPEVVTRVASQPGIPNKLLEFLPDGMQTPVRCLAAALASKVIPGASGLGWQVIRPLCPLQL